MSSEPQLDPRVAAPEDGSASRIASSRLPCRCLRRAPALTDPQDLTRSGGALLPVVRGTEDQPVAFQRVDRLGVGSGKRIDDLDSCLFEITAVPGDDCELVNEGRRCDQAVLDRHGSAFGAKLGEKASPA